MVKVKSEASRKIWLNMKVKEKENMLLQKSRVGWDKEGNLNIKYFHSILKLRRRRNFIGSITTDKGEVEEVGMVKEEVRRHFEAKFVEVTSERPLL